MLKGFLFSAAVGAVALFSVSAQAIPASPMQPEAGSLIEHVSGGCGRGFHRNGFGQCRANGGVVISGGVRRGCWWTRTPEGRRRICN
jgi:hypothetical protein